jgi:hypothetical protein
MLRINSRVDAIESAALRFVDLGYFFEQFQSQYGILPRTGKGLLPLPVCHFSSNLSV